MRRWDGEDRRKLSEWVGGNAYRLAFLVHTAPIRQNTLERIVRGYHDPGPLLAARLRDLLEKHPRGAALPHEPALLGA